MREKYSGGPNFKATSARGGAMNISPTMLNVPAINDPTDSQGGSGPSPSCHLVSIEAGYNGGSLAGYVHEIEVVDPPYMAP